MFELIVLLFSGACIIGLTNVRVKLNMCAVEIVSATLKSKAVDVFVVVIEIWDKVLFCL